MPLPIPGFDIATGGGGLSAGSSASSRAEGGNTAGLTFGDFNNAESGPGWPELVAGGLFVLGLVYVVSKVN